VKLRTFAQHVLSVIALSALPGCFPSCLFDRSDPEPRPQPLPTEDEPISSPPWIQGVDIPTWPPPGPATEITAWLNDDEGMTDGQFVFASTVPFAVSGTAASVTVTGAQLGEGYGTMAVIVWDEDDSVAQQLVTNLLVDLSPPEGELLQSVFQRAEGADVLLWVGDAWVLGGAELTFNGVTQAYSFEEGYPSTLGEEWDTSLITLPSMAFPEGAGKAVLRVWDAAGNQAFFEVDLTLDGTPPVAGITSPAPDSTVSGLVTIEVTGADEGKDPVQIDVFVAGTPIATLPGPSGEVTVDVSELAKGKVTIEALARDAAGNTSPPASIDVVIE
jgi:hypothetical protein